MRDVGALRRETKQVVVVWWARKEGAKGAREELQVR